MIENSGLINGSMIINENKDLLGIIKTIDVLFNLGGLGLLKSKGIFNDKKLFPLNSI